MCDVILTENLSGYKAQPLYFPVPHLAPHVHLSSFFCDILTSSRHIVNNRCSSEVIFLSSLISVEESKSLPFVENHNFSALLGCKYGSFSYLKHSSGTSASTIFMTLSSSHSHPQGKLRCCISHSPSIVMARLSTSSS